MKKTYFYPNKDKKRMEYKYGARYYCKECRNKPKPNKFENHYCDYYDCHNCTPKYENRIRMLVTVDNWWEKLCRNCAEELDKCSWCMEKFTKEDEIFTEDEDFPDLQENEDVDLWLQKYEEWTKKQGEKFEKEILEYWK